MAIKEIEKRGRTTVNTYAGKKATIQNTTPARDPLPRIDPEQAYDRINIILENLDNPHNQNYLLEKKHNPSEIKTKLEAILSKIKIDSHISKTALVSYIDTKHNQFRKIFLEDRNGEAKIAERHRYAWIAIQLIRNYHNIS